MPCLLVPQRAQTDGYSGAGKKGAPRVSAGGQGMNNANPIASNGGKPGPSPPPVQPPSTWKQILCCCLPTSVHPLGPRTCAANGNKDTVLSTLFNTFKATTEVSSNKKVQNASACKQGGRFV